MQKYGIRKFEFEPSVQVFLFNNETYIYPCPRPKTQCYNVIIKFFICVFWPFCIKKHDQQTKNLNNQLVINVNVSVVMNSISILYSRNHSGLRLAIIVGRKILVYSWIHAEEWITFTDDTVQGFTQVQVNPCIFLDTCCGVDYIY